jgi:hypothetical protein
MRTNRREKVSSVYQEMQEYLVKYTGCRSFRILSFFEWCFYVYFRRIIISKPVHRGKYVNETSIEWPTNINIYTGIQYTIQQQLTFALRITVV